MSELSILINKLDKNIIKLIMSDLGATLYQEKPDELWYDTICHHGDSHKLCYYDETHTFHCYTNCGQMSIINLIMKVKNYNFPQAVAYFKKFLGSNYSRKGFKTTRETTEDFQIFNKNKDDLAYINKKENDLQNLNITKFYDENILNYFEEKYYTGWINEGISEESMYKFGIKWYELEKHIIIPHRNIDGKLIGIRRRSFQNKDIKNKYMPEIIEQKDYSHSLGLNLYGIYENQEAIKKVRKAVIVEGEKSVLLSDTYYGNKSIAVATCGFNISEWQINALRELGVNEVYLAFDKDYDLMNFRNKYSESSKEYKDCERYLERLNSLSQKMLRNFIVYIIIDRKNLLQIKDSPFDRGKEIYEELKKDALYEKIKLKNLLNNKNN